MRKLEIDLMPATKAQVSVDFSTELAAAAEKGDSAEVLLVGWGEPIPMIGMDTAGYLTGNGVADAVNLKNLQFQNIEDVKSISLVVETEIAGNVERKEYDLTPYNTMDAFQREKITIDGSITVRKGTRISVKFTGINTAEDAKPNTVLFADLTRHFCC